jgi:glycosyltransferase involved in cell wall biosynthesis
LICHQKKNGGKGSAIREAIARSSGEYAIVQDADLEYDPEDYKACLEPIRRGETKVVYGSRLMKKNNGRSYHSFYYGGKLVSLATNLIYGSRLTDEPTCYKTFEGNLLRGLSFEGDRFEWEPEITGKLIRLGHTIHEVPISYFPRHFDEGKKIGVKDGLQAIWVLLKWRWASLTHLQHCKK